MKLEELKKQLQERKAKSAWNKGVKAQALDFIYTMQEQTAETEIIKENLEKNCLMEREIGKSILGVAIR